MLHFEIVTTDRLCDICVDQPKQATWTVDAKIGVFNPRNAFTCDTCKATYEAMTQETT